jgi:hypothetical protein
MYGFLKGSIHYAPKSYFRPLRLKVEYTCM